MFLCNYVQHFPIQFQIDLNITYAFITGDFLFKANRLIRFKESLHKIFLFSLKAAMFFKLSAIAKMIDFEIKEFPSWHGLVVEIEGKQK